MFRLLLAIVFWTLLVPLAALICFPWTFLTGSADFLYRVAMWLAWTGVRLTGVNVEVRGRERFDPMLTYIYMCNHTSNLDPPIVVPVIPRRTSVLVKKELFRVPVLGRAMRLGDLVPVDRANRDAAIASVERAGAVMKKGLNMMVFPEGTRSVDGKLLPFKKGPFYLAMETGVPVIPMTIVGSHELWPKGRFGVRKGTVTVVFHEPMDPKQYNDREALMAAVRGKIESALPEQYRS
ncbi:MAG TPA: lysophospholipid acyltransferase family protein [Terriglobales bacterium]|nr:lysophospholipid acyltransferase family protein [Terriglobales bacterium]